MTTLAPTAVTISPAGMARYTLVYAYQNTDRGYTTGAALVGYAAGLGLSPPADVGFDEWLAIAREVVDT